MLLSDLVSNITLVGSFTKLSLSHELHSSKSVLLGTNKIGDYPREETMQSICQHLDGYYLLGKRIWKQQNTLQPLNFTASKMLCTDNFIAFTDPNINGFRSSIGIQRNQDWLMNPDFALDDTVTAFSAFQDTIYCAGSFTSTLPLAEKSLYPVLITNTTSNGQSVQAPQCQNTSISFQELSLDLAESFVISAISLTLSESATIEIKYPGHDRVLLKVNDIVCDKCLVNGDTLVQVVNPSQYGPKNSLRILGNATMSFIRVYSREQTLFADSKLHLSCTPTLTTLVGTWTPLPQFGLVAHLGSGQQAHLDFKPVIVVSGVYELSVLIPVCGQEGNPCDNTLNATVQVISQSQVKNTFDIDNLSTGQKIYPLGNVTLEPGDLIRFIAAPNRDTALYSITIKRQERRDLFGLASLNLTESNPTWQGLLNQPLPPRSQVNAVVRHANGIVYLGGAFDLSRPAFFGFIQDGKLEPIGGLDGPVRDMKQFAEFILLVGDFSLSPNGRNIAVFDTINRQWKAVAGGLDAGGDVIVQDSTRSMAVISGRFGAFHDGLNGSPVNSPNLVRWNVDNNQLDPIKVEGIVDALAFNQQQLLIAGDMDLSFNASNIAEMTPTGMNTFQVDTGLLSAGVWSGTRFYAATNVSHLVVHESLQYLIASGSFSSTNGSSIYVWNLKKSQPESFPLLTNDGGSVQINAIALSGNQLIAAGDFQKAGSSLCLTLCILALETKTWMALPLLTGVVSSIALGDQIYIGGKFGFGGAPVYLAVLNGLQVGPLSFSEPVQLLTATKDGTLYITTETGRLSKWQSSTITDIPLESASISSMAVADGHVFVGGNLTIQSEAFTLAVYDPANNTLQGILNTDGPIEQLLMRTTSSPTPGSTAGPSSSPPLPLWLVTLLVIMGLLFVGLGMYFFMFTKVKNKRDSMDIKYTSYIHIQRPSSEKSFKPEIEPMASSSWHNLEEESPRLFDNSLEVTLVPSQEVSGLPSPDAAKMTEDARLSFAFLNCSADSLPSIVEKRDSQMSILDEHERFFRAQTLPLSRNLTRQSFKQWTLDRALQPPRPIHHRHSYSSATHSSDSVYSTVKRHSDGIAIGTWIVNPTEKIVTAVQDYVAKDRCELSFKQGDQEGSLVSAPNHIGLFPPDTVQ
ncbi:hypothetical protein EDD86DRAFT_255972 [Gorgonomyces haynaldii]|nr:hypothetical protein EDD86DRAFT_255972 [Gorgonomyces haynaldii]